MPVETGVDGIEDLNPSWPLGTDPKSQGDDHIRNTKAAVQGSFPNMTGPNAMSAALSVGEPTSASDAATKNYVDEAIAEWGVVQDNGTLLASGGGGVALSKLGTGGYRLTFTQAAKTVNHQSVQVTAVNFLEIAVVGHAIAQSSTVVEVYITSGDGAGFNYADAGFMFARHWVP